MFFLVEIGAAVLSQVQHSEKVTNGWKKRGRGTLKQIQCYYFLQLVLFVQHWKQHMLGRKHCSSIVLNTLLWNIILGQGHCQHCENIGNWDWRWWGGRFNGQEEEGKLNVRKTSTDFVLSPGKCQCLTWTKLVLCHIFPLAFQYDFKLTNSDALWSI